MDPAKSMASGVTVKLQGAPSAYHVASRVDQLETSLSQFSSPTMSANSDRKKRGRPRKYKPDESLVGSFQTSPSPTYSEHGRLAVSQPVSGKKHKSKIGTEKLDDWVECSTGSSLLPHVIIVNTGEDITTKINEFARQGPRAVCIVSGSGTVSNVTIQHPNSSGGILTYEGIFEILSLSGSFTPTEMPDSKNGRSGNLTITLSGADGRVVGGLVSGVTIAATPIKVVVASFLLSSNSDEFKLKNQLMISGSGPMGQPVPKSENHSSNGIQGPRGTYSPTPNN
ncbi:AT hook motif DNA-binding family protein [Striga asiatica]|uniref:AT-hook motif nuclear-localized protein n=1 Tax=Striga asiatica TaxID=4170 RepID=A0A5A7PEW3_STRAF|nr:AT hook motif DNA-binding family protein [Striga asiatica]